MQTTPPIPASRPGILLADDFADCRELYRDYLEFTGYTVITAADGIEAMQILRREPLTAVAEA